MSLNSPICAPDRKNLQRKDKTCFTDGEVLQLVTAYNKYVMDTVLSNKKEPYSSPIDTVGKSKIQLLSELRKRFKNVCNDNDYCITEQKFMHKITGGNLENVFRPVGPKKSSEWLSTSDINSVMKQYEKIYADFYFIGAVPLNCDEINFCPSNSYDFDKLTDSGKRRFGIVFNHDRYGEPGSHWVALFMDDINGEISFCDSCGNPPIDNIKNVIRYFKKYYESKYGKSPKYNENKRKYQRDDSECGIYSCNFIIRMLSGESFNSIVNNPLSFEKINSCRNVYFVNKPSKYKPDPKCDPVFNQ